MNYEPKSIFLFLVDVSSNVDDQHLIKANLFIETFAQYAINDKMLQNRVIVGIIEFDVDARVIQSPQLAGDVPSIISGDSPVSNLFKAISTSLVLLRDVKDDLISHGQSFKRPRIIILSDGKCDDDAYMPLYKESLVHAKQNNSYEVIRIGYEINSKSEYKQYLFDYFLTNEHLAKTLLSDLVGNTVISTDELGDQSSEIFDMSFDLD